MNATSPGSDLLKKKPWENMSFVGALPPLATTVTSIKQSHELLVG